MTILAVGLLAGLARFIVLGNTGVVGFDGHYGAGMVFWSWLALAHVLRQLSESPDQRTGTLGKDFSEVRLNKVPHG